MTTFQYFNKPELKVDLPNLGKLFSCTIHSVANEIIWSEKYFPFLYGLSYYFAPASILEIGTQHGYSIIALAKGALAAGVSSIRIVTIEKQAIRVEKARENWDSCMSGFDVDIEFVNENSDKVELEEKFDMAYIDGTHRFTSVFKDFAICYPALNSGGVLMLDDTHIHCVRDAISKCVIKFEIEKHHIASCATKHGTGIIHKP